MKKYTALILSLILLISLAMPVSAAQTTKEYTDEASGLILSIPGDWKVTSWAEDRTYVWFHYGTLNDYVNPEKTFESLDVWSNLDAQTQQKMPRESVNNSLFTIEEMADILEVDAQYVTMVTLGGREYFHTEPSFGMNEANWVRVENGWFYRFRINKCTQQNQFDLKQYKTMIETARYPGDNPAGQVYQEPRCGIRLHMPAYWVMENGDSTETEIHFTYEDIRYTEMSFECIDVFGLLDADIQARLPRKDINNDLYTIEEMGQILEMDPEDITMTTISGREYFFANGMKIEDRSGIMCATPDLRWVTCENGWMYIYSFMGSDITDDYDNYQNMILTAEYPPVN